MRPEIITAKKRMISVLLVSLVFLLFIMNFVSAQEREFFIDAKIVPQGVISTDYNVVGDIFIYNVTLYNNNSEAIEDVISIKVIGPNNLSYIQSTPSYNVKIEPYSYTSIIPYINFTQKEDTYIWQFNTAGDYKLEICSSNPLQKFVKWYTIPVNQYVTYKKEYYSYGCFNYYFSAMPEWQYNLFKRELSAAEGSLNSSKDSLSILGRLETISSNMEGAIKGMSTSSNYVLLIAIIALFVSILNLLVLFEDEKKKEYLKFVGKSFLKILARIFYAMIITIIILVIFFWVLIKFLN